MAEVEVGELVDLGEAGLGDAVALGVVADEERRPLSCAGPQKPAVLSHVPSRYLDAGQPFGELAQDDLGDDTIERVTHTLAGDVSAGQRGGAGGAPANRVGLELQGYRW